ncbi:hypothetical protein KDA82_37160, partial [Streptomyces daliensis]|nr:hypothetical protein [Streptomyces daliensis]
PGVGQEGSATQRPGRVSRSEPTGSWPAPGVEHRRIPLAGPDGLTRPDGGPGTAVLRSPLALGAASGDFLKSGDVPGRDTDQAADDGRSGSGGPVKVYERPS